MLCIGQNSLSAPVKYDELAYFPLPITSEFAMYIREQVISGAVLTETRSTAYEDLTSKALLRCLVAVGS